MKKTLRVLFTLAALAGFLAEAQAHAGVLKAAKKHLVKPAAKVAVKVLKEAKKAIY